jgi:hypothetical protein
MTPHPSDPNRFRPDGPDDLDADGLTDDDLAVHAVADDDATEEQRARVDADASLRERVVAIESLRSRLAAPVDALAPDVADEMRRTALETAPSDQDGDTGRDRSTEGSPVGRVAGRTPWLVAAAVVLLLALGAVALPRLATDRSDTAASSASVATSTTVASADASSEGAPSAPEAVSSADAAGRNQTEARSFADSLPVALGDVGTLADLVARAVTELDAPDATGSGPRSGSVRPDDDVVACLTTVVPETGAELVAEGTVDSTDHLVIVTGEAGAGPGARSVEVVRLPDCVVVDRSVR